MHAAHAMPGHWPGAQHDHHPGSCRGGWRAMTGGRGRHGAGAGFGWGPPGPGGRGGHMHGRSPRARRGDVRAAILALLAEEPRNGYGIMQEIDERSGGVWRPSPGAVYPALAQLEDEGLVRAEETDGRRAFTLTDEGRAHVQERGDELKAPWDTVTGGAKGGFVELRDLVGQLAAAVMQAAAAGDAAQAEEVKKILVEARRGVYRILADDSSGE